MGRHPLILALVAAVLAWLAPLARAQTSEELVKAIFVYRFASFVTWPAGTFTEEQAPIRLCVLGSEPFAHELVRSAEGQSAGGRAFEVRGVASASNIATCHVLYVVGERAESALRAAHDLAILTVTDGAAGGETRGMIHFVTVDGRVRFHIDDARAGGSRILIDPRLLSLALSVRRRERS